MHYNENIGWIAASVPAILAMVSGIAKLAGLPKIVNNLQKMNVAAYRNYFGIAEIIFAAFFLYPPTVGIGFMLLICYFSGALAADLSHKNSVKAPIVILTLIFVAGFLKNPTLFLTN